MSQKVKTGFTLLELLIVIGILAVLAAIVALVLNPAELLKQARDGQRLNDLQSLNRALGLYLTSSGTSTLGACVSPQATAGTASYGPATTTAVTNASSAVTGAGWVTVDLRLTSGGSPLSRLPVDPVNSTTYYFNYFCNIANSTWEIDSNMESVKFANGGAGDVESRDGGNNINVFEVGNDPGMDLI